MRITTTSTHWLTTGIAVGLLLLTVAAKAQSGWEKVKQEDLCLYNEPGRIPAAQFTIKQSGGPATLVWNRVSYNSETVTYECTSQLMGYVNRNTDALLVKSAFGLEYSREYLPPVNNQPPTWYFEAPGGSAELAEFTYAVKNMGSQIRWFPRLRFNRRSYDLIKYTLSAERICRQNKSMAFYRISTSDEIRPRGIRIAGKDYSARFDAQQGLEVLEENAAADVVFNLTDERGYTVSFRISVDVSGDFARCPTAVVNDVKALRSLDRKGDSVNPVFRLKGIIKGLDPSSLKVSERSGVKIELDQRPQEIRFTVYTTPAEWARGLVFRDAQNTLTLSDSQLSPAQRTMLATRLPRIADYAFFTRDGSLTQRRDTLFVQISNDWLGKKQNLTLRFGTPEGLPLASLRVNGTSIPGTEFSVPITENGKALTIQLEDSVGFRQEKSHVLMMRDEEDQQAVSLITADSVYRRYLGEGFQAGSNFRQPPAGLERLYLQKTTVDLTQPFTFSYQLLPGTTTRPSLLLKKPGRIDYFSIVFRNDSALLYQQNDDGSYTNLLEGMPLDYQSDMQLTVSRRNNFLPEGEAARRDWLFINGKPLRKTDPAVLWTDTVSLMGLAFPEPSNHYRFARITLSKHRVEREETVQEEFTDVQLLHQFFTGEKGEGLRTRALFEAASRNSFAILIANSSFLPSPFGAQQQPLPAAREVIDSLKGMLCTRYQFDSSHVRVLSNITINDLELLFRSLSNPDYFRRFFGLQPASDFQLSTVQLLIGIASHGTPDGKLILADGWDRDLKGEPYLRSLLPVKEGSAQPVFRSLLFVEDICYGTFSKGQGSPLVEGLSGGKESLLELYQQGLFDPVAPSFSFHAASYNLGDLSVNLKGLRTFVQTLGRLPVNTDYFTDLDVTRAAERETGIPSLLLKPFGLQGNNIREDGRFLFLPRDHYKHLPE